MKAAREILAEAHKRMTPEQIAAHALDLAQMLEGSHIADRATRDALDTSNNLNSKLIEQRRQQHLLIRRAASLIAKHKPAGAYEIVAELAALDLVDPPPPLDRSAEIDLPESIFNPLA